MEFLFLSAPVVIVCQLQLGMWKISCGLGKTIGRIYEQMRTILSSMVAII